MVDGEPGNSAKRGKKRIKLASLAIEDWPVGILEVERRALWKSIEHWREVCASSRFGLLDSSLDIGSLNCPLCRTNLEPDEFFGWSVNCSKCSLRLVTGVACGAGAWKLARAELGAVQQENWTSNPGPACREMLGALVRTLAIVAEALESCLEREELRFKEKKMANAEWSYLIKGWRDESLEREREALVRTVEHWREICSARSPLGEMLRASVRTSAIVYVDLPRDVVKSAWSLPKEQVGGLDIDALSCPLCHLHGMGCAGCSLMLTMGVKCNAPDSPWQRAYTELGDKLQERWLRDPGPACREMLREIEETLAMVEKELARRKGMKVESKGAGTAG